MMEMMPPVWELSLYTGHWSAVPIAGSQSGMYMHVPVSSLPPALVVFSAFPLP